MPLRRAVITGLGLISPLGLGTEAFRAALASGTSGVHTFRLFDPSALPVRFGGEVEEFDPLAFLEKKERKQLKIMVRTIQFAVAASRLALRDAGLTAIEPERLGIVMGTGIIPGDMVDLALPGQASLNEDETVDMERWGNKGIALIPPMWMLNHVPNMTASHSAILHDARGPNNTITQYDAAALLATGEAFRALQHGRADAMLSGGTDTRTGPVSVARYGLYSRLSRRNDEPARACRPFDAERDGQVLAEGAGVMALEEREHALRRGARVLAEVVGFGAAYDLRRDGAGVVRAIRAALADADVGTDDIDHVNAHAGGGEDDAREARALHEALPGIPVLAMKSWMGNAGTGASVMELAPSVLALAGSPLPPALNYERPAEDCPVSVLREPRRVMKPCVLKVALTDRGHCAALVVRRAE
jgi:3-oxoacyl-[acyl-carrier-protein] synthase II